MSTDVVSILQAQIRISTSIENGSPTSWWVSSRSWLSCDGEQFKLLPSFCLQWCLGADIFSKDAVFPETRSPSTQGSDWVQSLGLEDSSLRRHTYPRPLRKCSSFPTQNGVKMSASGCETSVLRHEQSVEKNSKLKRSPLLETWNSKARQKSVRFPAASILVTTRIVPATKFGGRYSETFKIFS